MRIQGRQIQLDALILESVPKSANYTATDEDSTILVDASGGVVTISLPPAADVVGIVYTVVKIDSSTNAVVLDPDGVETINGVATQSIAKQWASAQIQSDGTAWHIINGVQLADAFGGSLYTAEDETESSTGSTTPVQKLRLTTPVIPAGTYIIQWYCEVANGNKQNETTVRVQVDDTTTLTEVSQDFNEALQFKPIVGFDIETLTEAVHNVDIDFYTSANTAYIREAHLILWNLGT